MIVDRWIRRLLPRTDKFLNLFVEDIENIASACRVLRELLDARTEPERARLVQAIEDLEHRGDEITHQVYHELSLTFITTLDREDIGGLATNLDNILDNIDRVATSIRLYQVTEFDDHIRDLAEILERSVAELSRAIPLLRDLKELELIRNACVRVNAYENEADKVFHRALGRLFQEEKDPINLIKQKEILAVLESATDRCEDAAVLIESILVKQG
jgi:predicted phosphate transport protein (TIGR00153 family)